MEVGGESLVSDGNAKGGEKGGEKRKRQTRRNPIGGNVVNKGGGRGRKEEVVRKAGRGWRE